MSRPLLEPADGGGWLVGDDDAFIAADRVARPVDLGTVSRFGASRWNLTVLATNPHGCAESISWDGYSGPEMRESVRRASWCLINMPTPEELLERKGTARAIWRSASNAKLTTSFLRDFTNWLTARGVALFAQVTTDDLEAYAIHVSAEGSRVATRILYAISLLWSYGPHLLPRDRIPTPPWEEGDLNDYLPEREARDGTIPPIHPAVMSPLLVWALRFVEDFADDIIAGCHEREELTSRALDGHAKSTTPRVREFLDEHIAHDRPIPGLIRNGKKSPACLFLAGTLESNPEQIGRLVKRRPRLVIADGAPLQAPVRGLLHGRPWTDHIDFYDVPDLMEHLATACMTVAGYLSGMRPTEVLGLQAGCCPDPDSDGQQTVHYRIYGNVLKGVRDERGRPVPDGRPRDLPWTVIMPVVRAIRVLESIAEGDHLFPAHPSWNLLQRRDVPHEEEPPLLRHASARGRIARFIQFTNRLADRHGLMFERIPADPDGAVTLRRFRRTIAWHIARLPGGRIALATQYGHLRASSITDASYSSRTHARTPSRPGHRDRPRHRRLPR